MGESVLDRLQAEAEERGKPAVQHHDGEVKTQARNIVRRRAMHWVETRRGAYVMDAGGQYFRIRHQGEDKWLVERRTKYQKAYAVLADGLPLNYAFGVAEDTARALKVGWATNPKAGWRDGPLSKKQVDLCKKFEIPLDDVCSSGEASDAFLRVAGDWYWPRA